MNEPVAQEAASAASELATAAVPSHAPSGVRPDRAGLWLALLALAVVAAVGALGATRLVALERQLQAMQQRLDELATLQQRDAAAQRDFEERIAATARRSEQLEQQLTVLAGRDTAPDADLRRLREEHVLAEVDELLTLAGTQLQIGRDPAAAAVALASADARVARLARPQFFALREALARDIERLRKTPSLDLTGTVLRLDRLVQGVDSWHLLSDPTRRLVMAPAKARAENAPAPGRFSSVSREIGEALRDLVRIRTVDAPESVLLASDQQQLVREHLRVRLLNARQAMLMRNEVVFRSDLADCQALIGRYFDPVDPLVAAALAQLKGLGAVPIDAPVPTLDDSLAALRSARPSLP